MMQDVFNLYHDLITGRPTMRGGKYGVDMLPTTCHVYFGEVIGATANGRKLTSRYQKVFHRRNQQM